MTILFGNEVIDMEYKGAIKKQIPKKPIEQIRLLGSDKGGKCPSCNKYINNCRHWMYCECGQKIDWSDNK